MKEDINWEQVRIDASINIMNAILSSTFTTFLLEFIFKKQISDLAVWYADKLVEELKKEKINFETEKVMMDRWKLLLTGVGLGTFSSIIGPIIFNHFYFKKLDEQGVEYVTMDKAASIWGGIFGTAITAVVLLSIL